MTTATTTDCDCPMPTHHHHSHPPPDTSRLEANSHLAELLEAAAKASGVARDDAARDPAAHPLRRAAKNTDLRGTAQQEEAIAAGQKRKRTTTPPPLQEHDGARHESGEDETPSPRKRTKTTATAEAEFQTPHTTQNYGLTDARAAGVHSAAALFRRSSGGGARSGGGGAGVSGAKKHTRPPMSKLFTSLQLTPENFLRLQAAAKQYMLDEAHAERQSCVGSRGKGDTDMVKLRLFNCVRDFLNDGVGDRFFGPDVPAVTEAETLDEATAGRKWVWPRDGNKIISLVTPLMRRMVTNERQRRYAIEARRGGGKRREAAAASQGTTTPQGSSLSQMAASSSQMDLDDNPSVDPSLDPSSRPSLSGPPLQPPQPPPATVHPTSPPPPSHYRRFVPPRYLPTDATSYPPTRNVIQIVVTRNNTVLLPRIDLAAVTPNGGPHHGMPLTELLGVVREEIRVLGLGGGAERRESDARSENDRKNEGERGEGEKAADEKTDAQPSSPSRTSCSTTTPEDAATTEHQQDTNPQPQSPGAANLPPQSQSQAEQPSQANQQHPATSTHHLSHAPSPHQAQPAPLPPTHPKLELRALTPSGLRPVRDEQDWAAARRDVGGAAYMEGVLRVVVEVL